MRKKKKGLRGLFVPLIILFILILLISYNPVSIRLATIAVAVYHDINPVIFYRLIRTESSFRSFAISRKAAIGLGQIQEDTAFYMSKKHKRGLLFIPLYNLDLSAKYLKYLLARFKGNWSLTLAAYNWGETKVANRINGMEIEPKRDYRDKFRDIEETYHYIGKIMPQ